MIRDTVAQSIMVELEDFDLSPFNQHGGIGKVRQVFGSKLQTLVAELSEALV
jgi:type I restriction enzyme, R subunit